MAAFRLCRRDGITDALLSPLLRSARAPDDTIGLKKEVGGAAAGKRLVTKS
jgi:hypothetical protein